MPMIDCLCGAGHYQGAELGASEIDGDGIGEFHCFVILSGLRPNVCGRHGVPVFDCAVILA